MIRSFQGNGPFSAAIRAFRFSHGMLSPKKIGKHNLNLKIDKIIDKLVISCDISDTLKLVVSCLVGLPFLPGLLLRSEKLRPFKEPTTEAPATPSRGSTENI